VGRESSLLDAEWPLAEMSCEGVRMGMRAVLLYLALICILVYVMQFIQNDTAMYRIAFIFSIIIAGFALYELFNLIEEWMEGKTTKKRIRIMLLYLVFLYILIWIMQIIENKFGIVSVAEDGIVKIAEIIGVIIGWEVIRGFLDR
jgi:uncharacterized membrane-anchored protein